MNNSGSGWKNESRRHSLARKGIKTNKKRNILKSNGTSKENIFDKAKKYFGITDDPTLAGWILPDGSMLDFSGNENFKSIKHNEINRIGIEMHEFINMGAIRLNLAPYGNDMNLNLNKPLTNLQKLKISKIIMQYHPYIYIDISNKPYDEWDEEFIVAKDFNDTIYPNTLFSYIDKELKT